MYLPFVLIYAQFISKASSWAEGAVSGGEVFECAELNTYPRRTEAQLGVVRVRWGLAQAASAPRAGPAAVSAAALSPPCLSR
jgi:hypothetical protein